MIRGCSDVVLGDGLVGFGVGDDFVGHNFSDDGVFGLVGFGVGLGDDFASDNFSDDNFSDDFFFVDYFFGADLAVGFFDSLLKCRWKKINLCVKIVSRATSQRITNEGTISNRI